jgi:hypothetical protein
VRRGGQAAHSLTKLLALVAACAAMLAVCAQTSTADPVAGVLGAVDATTTQQLGTVTHDATAAIPLPANTPPDAVVQASASATQSVAAVPQAVAGAGAAARSSTSVVVERVRASDSGASGTSGTRGGSNDRPLPPPPPSILTVANHAGHVVASATPAPGAHAATVPALHRIVPSRVGRVTSKLADTARHAPVARSIAGHASRLAGALLGAVVEVAASARDTLAAIPVPAATALSRAIVSPTRPLTDHAGAAIPATEPPGSEAPLSASFAAEPVHALTAAATPVDTQSIGQPASRQPAPSVTPESRQVGSAVANGPQSSAASHELPPAAKPMPGEPAPASPPSGFSPASGADAGGGLSAATFLALAALLLLAAPRALRRLRPTTASWRTAQFALIPARPG